MGFLGGVFKKIGGALKSVAKGVMKFAQSPFGKLLLNVGLGFLTGGASSLLTGALGKIGSSLLGKFGGMASKFLGSATSLLSKTGLGAVADFAKSATGSGDLLSMAKGLFNARAKEPKQPDQATTQIADNNVQQLLAYQQAQQLLSA